MQPAALARIQAGKHRTWTADLVGDLLVMAFRELPGRSIRVADSRIEPTHTLFSHIALQDLLTLAGHCVPSSKDRRIMMYLANRKAWPEQGMSHEEAARYEKLSRRGLYGAGNRARSQMARCLNEKWLLPPELDAPRLEGTILTVVPLLT